MAPAQDCGGSIAIIREAHTMTFTNWVRGIFGTKTRPIGERRGRLVLRVERMEDRITPTNTSFALYDTGVDTNGNALPTTANVLDPHYSLSTNPFNPISTQTFVTKTPLPGNFTANKTTSPASQWISPFSDQTTMPPGVVVGIYTYNTTFTIPTLNGSALHRYVTISGAAACDDDLLFARINNTQVGANLNFDGNTLSPFTLNSINVNPGLNTLTFVVRNNVTATGLRVQGLGISSSAQTNTPTVADPASAKTVTGGNYTITGTAQAGSTVRVYRDTNNNGRIDSGEPELGNQPLPAGVGTYGIQVSLLPNADNQFLVTAQAASSDESNPVAAPTITQDSSAPAPPGITSPAAATGTKNLTFLITGTAEANSTVKVYQGGAVVNQGSAGAGSFSLSVNLTPNVANDFTVTATDSVGNESAPTTVPTITNDTTPPAAPAVTSPGAAVVTGNLTFTITGTAEVGSTVKLFKGGAVVDQKTAGAGGSFSFSVNLTKDAPNTFTLTATDPAGNESTLATVPTITNDSTPPAAPTVTTPAFPITAGSLTTRIAGIAEANALVRVYQDKNNNGAIDAGEPVVGTPFQLSSGGTVYNITDVPLSKNVDNHFLVTAADAVGNESLPAAVPTISQDSIPPGVTVTSPTTPGATRLSTATIAGTTTESNVIVKVYKDANNNNVIDAGEATPLTQFPLNGGVNTYNLSVPLDLNAANNFLVTATDAAGNESAPADVPTITHDTIAPAGPLVTAPVAPVFTRNATVPVTGTAEANSLVRLYLDVNHNNSVDAGEPIVDQHQLNGGLTGYSLLGTLTANTANDFLVTATDAAGNESAPADVPTITHDTVPPGPPAVTAPAIAVATRNPNFTIVGQAEANALVKVYADLNNNNAIDPGELVVASLPLTSGNTTFGVLTPLTANAPNNFLVTATDAAGNESGPADVPTITQDSIAPPVPVVTAPAAPAVVNAATVTVAGSAEANSLVRVYRDINNNNTIDAGEPVANLFQLSGGVTSFFVPVPLNQDAANNFLVTATDAAGNESVTVDVPTITEDSTPPAAPGVTFPAAPTSVNADDITIAGAAEANAVVRVYRDANNNNVIDPGELAVASYQLIGGVSSYSVPAPLLQNAANNFLVTATDAAGNESGPTDVPTVTEDSVAPVAPTVTTPAAAVTTRSATFTVAGKTEASALVRMYLDANDNGAIDPGELLNSQQLPNGATTFGILVSLGANAANNFLVTAVDAAGNESAPTDVPTITQDSIAPASPVVTTPSAPFTTRATITVVAGSAEANAVVKVYADLNNNNAIDPGELVLKSLPLTSGATTYSFTDVPLTPNVANNFLVTATDAAGNESIVADVPTITQDATPPAAPTVTAPTAAKRIHAATFTLTGAAEVNALVKVYRDANANGAIDPGELVVAQQQLPVGITAYSIPVNLNQDAANNFLVTAADAVQNESAPTPVPTITEDSTPPGSTTVTTPAAPTTLNADNFTIKGTAEANALVKVYSDLNNNGTIDGRDAVVASLQLLVGATAYSIPVPLTQDAANDFLVTATDAVQNESAPVDVPTITEDSTPPGNTTVTAPAAAVTVSVGPFTIRGTTEANALVKVYKDADKDGVPDSPIPVASKQLVAGATTFAIDTPLTANATNTFVVTATDSTGNQSNPATAVPAIIADAAGPTGVAIQSFAVAGAAPAGTEVGTVSAADAAGSPLTYTIVAGNDAGAFALDRATGRITVADATALRRLPRAVVLTVRVSNAADPPLTLDIQAKIALTDPALPQGFSAGAEDGGGVAVLYNPDGTKRLNVHPFPGSSAAVRVATGDVNGDRIPDLVAASGPGQIGQVRVYDGATGGLLYQTQPFEDSFTGGLYVEAADLTGDGRADLIITPDVGGGPRVTVVDVAARKTIVSFMGIDDPTFRGGVRVSLADVDADGTPDLLVAAGTGGGPRVAVFDGATLTSSPTHLFNDFFVFEDTLRNGVYITGGDLNGDGYADIIVGGGPGGAPRVFAISARDLLNTGTTVVLANFFAGDPSTRTAVRVTTADLDGDNRADLITGAGSGNGNRLTVYLGKDIPADGTPPTDPDLSVVNGSITFGGGVNVG